MRSGRFVERPEPFIEIRGDQLLRPSTHSFEDLRSCLANLVSVRVEGAEQSCLAWGQIGSDAQQRSSKAHSVSRRIKASTEVWKSQNDAGEITACLTPGQHLALLSSSNTGGGLPSPP